ncbi:hypothetical protein F5Y00DRAFT_271496 [Daldinia vernicosa]|uniref:uncharacterized protein n=1 Tax=Daldinia vernicosa TaxID=114800 RepID=UPI002008CBD3|nr:uncharacterized protein F5Y00DRAFT_271496 [Daldinia vernicosa]KAI0847020.1 hypothetical protein F5Y00DRAFT_271496 [Daldinia vernicosa]
MDRRLEGLFGNFSFPVDCIRAIVPYAESSANLHDLGEDLTTPSQPQQPLMVNTPTSQQSHISIAGMQHSLAQHNDGQANNGQANDGQDEADNVSPASGFSTNYHGTKNERNKPDDISDDENCAVWIEGLPTDIDYPMLLAGLRGTGKIYAVFINDPVKRHHTCAAKVEFWGRDGVTRLFQKVGNGELRFGELVPTVRPNRVKKGAQPVSHRSRVIEITGPTGIVNIVTITAELQQAFYYDLELVETLWTEEGQSMMRWTFASYRNQAETAMRIFASRKNNVEPSLWQQVHFRWGRDPCEP